MSHGIETEINSEDCNNKLINNEGFHSIIMQLATRFVNLPLNKLDEHIDSALMQIGNYAKIDRAYVLRYYWDRNKVSNTHEWCAEGISSEMAGLQEQDIAPFPEWFDTHKAGKIIYVPDVSKLDPDALLRQILEPQQIKTVITVPIMYGGQCLGCVGFDAVKSLRTWTEEETSLLKVFAEIIANADNRLSFEAKLLEKNQELQTLNELAQEMTAKAEMANEAKSVFLANMSHEIRTPMNSVIGFIDLVLDTEITETQKNFLRTAAASAHDLLKIIDEILDYSKIEIGRMTLEEIPASPHAILEHACEMMRHSANKKNIRLIVNIPPNAPSTIVMDALRMRQVFINLLGNAVKFTTEGEIEVGLEWQALDNQIGEFTFFVRDTGIGISEQQVQKLFKAFTQGDTSTTRKFGGTGLGLVISQKIVEKMGGNIKLLSELGLGSKFEFTLKKNYFQAPDMDAPLLKGLGKVLVLHDHELSASILERLLQYWQLPVEKVVLPADANLLDYLPMTHQFDVTILSIVRGMWNQNVAQMYVEHGAVDKIILLHDVIGDDETSCMKHHPGIQHCLSQPLRQDDLAKLLMRAFTVPEVAHALSSPDLKDIILPNPTTSKKVIMIAEDSTNNMLLLKAILKKLVPECMVAEAENGQAAWERYLQGGIDLLLLDIQMPIMDGYECVRLIRQDEESNKIEFRLPIIAITASAMRGEKEKCIGLGMDEYISKPINIQQLKDYLHQYL